MDESEVGLLSYINSMLIGDNRLKTPVNLDKFYVKDFPIPLSTEQNVRHNRDNITKFKPSISVFMYNPDNIVHWALRFELLKNCELLPTGLEGNPIEIEKIYQKFVETELPFHALGLFMKSKIGFKESKKYVICVASSFSHRTLDSIIINGPKPHHELHAMIEFTVEDNNIIINKIVIRKRQTPVLYDIYSESLGEGYYDYTPKPSDPEYYKLHSFAYNYSLKFLIIFFYQVIRQLVFRRPPTLIQQEQNRIRIIIQPSTKYSDIFVDNLKWFNLVFSEYDLKNINLTKIVWKSSQSLNTNNNYVSNKYYLVDIGSENYYHLDVSDSIFKLNKFSEHIAKFGSNLEFLNEESYNTIGGNFIINDIVIGIDNPLDVMVISKKNIAPYTRKQFIEKTVEEVDKFINLTNVPFELYNNENYYNGMLFRIFYEYISSLNEKIGPRDLFFTNDIVGFRSMNKNDPELKKDTWFHLLSVEDIISEFMERTTMHTFNLSWNKNGKKCESKFVILYGRGNQIAKTTYTADVITKNGEEIGKHLLMEFYKNAVQDVQTNYSDNVTSRHVYFEYKDIEQSYHLSIYDINEKKIVAIALFSLYDVSNNMGRTTDIKTELFKNNSEFFSTKKIFYLSDLFTLSEYGVDGMMKFEDDQDKNKIYKIDSSKKTQYSPSLASLLVWCTLNLAQSLAAMYIPSIIGYGVVAISPRTENILNKFGIKSAKIYNNGKNKKLNAVFNEVSNLLLDFYKKYLPQPFLEEYTYIKNNYIESEQLEKIRIFRLKVNNFVKNLKAGDEDLIRNIKNEYNLLMKKYYNVIAKRYEYEQILMKLGGNFSYSTFPDFRFLNFTNKDDMLYTNEMMRKVEREFKEICGLIYQHLTLEKRPGEYKEEQQEENPAKRLKTNN